MSTASPAYHNCRASTAPTSDKLQRAVRLGRWVQALKKPANHSCILSPTQCHLAFLRLSGALPYGSKRGLAWTASTMTTNYDSLVRAHYACWQGRRQHADAGKRKQKQRQTQVSRRFSFDSANNPILAFSSPSPFTTHASRLFLLQLHTATPSTCKRPTCNFSSRNTWTLDNETDLPTDPPRRVVFASHPINRLHLTSSPYSSGRLIHDLNLRFELSLSHMTRSSHPIRLARRTPIQPIKQSTIVPFLCQPCLS